MTTKLSLNMSNVNCRAEPPQIKNCWPRSSKANLSWVRTNDSEWVNREEPQQPLGNEILSFGPSPPSWLHPQAGQSYPQLSDSAFLPSPFWLPSAWPASSMKQSAEKGRRCSPAWCSQWCPQAGMESHLGLLEVILCALSLLWVSSRLLPRKPT